MLVKIFLAVALVVSTALLGLAWRQSTDEVAHLNAMTRSSAERLASVIVGNIETTMLQGDGIHVRNQVRRTSAALPDVEIEIFDQRGLEVFGEPAPAPPRSSLPIPLAATLADGDPRFEDGRQWRPIRNEVRCHECHPSEHALRGVLAFAPATVPPPREHVIGELVESAFIQVMTAEKEGELTALFAELSQKAPSIRAIGVYNRTGEVPFGVEVPGVTAGILEESLRAGSKRRHVNTERGSIELVPLPMEERCEQCHERDAPVRGVLAIALDGPITREATNVEQATLIDTSLRYIMLSSLGRLISAFLDAVVSARAVDEIVLYDPEGRTYYSSIPRAPPTHVGAALASRLAFSSFVGTSGEERIRVVQPLLNDAKCVRCHGSDAAVRGAVSVSLSTKASALAREAAAERATLFIAIALVVVLVVLYALIHVLVVKPVRKIGAVADAVSHGELDVSVRDIPPDGDEMQRLGTRMNEMIRGLRTALHLRRFVSRGTAEHARLSAATLTGSRMPAAAGERCNATILFTDIRGFTAYSETVPPETVVDMLNRYLQVQADIVEKYGGDIDKYVGDELMAVFHGEDGPRRAVRAALEMVTAVERAREAGEVLAVGCGISTGEVVYGPIGSTDRMDFTVIGDVVNTGARLCSSADGSEVLVSTAVRTACETIDDIALDDREPLQLKGKRQPFPVFRARWRDGSST